LSQRHGGWNSDDNQNNNLGRFRFAVTDSNKPVADPIPMQVRKLLVIPAAQRTLAQTNTIFSYWRTTRPEWKTVNEEIESLWKQHPEGSSQFVLKARHDQRETHVLKRGDFLSPGRTVTAGTPEILNPLPEGAPIARITFANWLADRNAPTTARAFVNRVWQSYFGTGLISTSEDLGTQGEAPSHPELLDWLAVEFMENGWSMKNLHKQIVMSATYQQSSHVNQALYTRDPYNRLLARGPRFRVEGEIVRDIALAVSGLLNPEIGGPSLYAPQPKHLTERPFSYGPKVWNEEQGPNRYRRALYTFRFRSVPYPMLQTFDTPAGDVSCVRRVRSNTPLQALMSLNEPLFMECAQALAVKTIQQPDSEDRARIIFAFRSCLSRYPTDTELNTLLGLLNKERNRMTAGEINSEDYYQHALNPDDPSLREIPAADLASWTIVSRVILNLDETITKE